MTQISEEGPTLRDYIRVVWMRKWVVVAFVIVFVVAAGGLAMHKPKVYQATARLTYDPPTNVANISSSATVDLNNLTLQLQSVGNDVASPGVRAKAEATLSGADKNGGYYSVSATAVAPATASNTAIPDSVDITALAASPTAAAHIANAYALAVIELRKTAEQQSLQAAQHLVQQQLDSFQSATSKLSPDYAALSLQLRDLQLAEATATGDFTVISPATPSYTPFSPKPVKSAILGFSAGLFFGIAAVFVLKQFDIRVRTHRDIAAALGLIIVGRLPRLPRHRSHEDGLVTLSEPSGPYSEALRVLRRNLDWSSIDEPLHLLLVSSCVKGEGKTVALCNLAVTLARSGRNVIVVDADLRNPSVHRLFKLPNTSGLTSVALGTVPLEKTLRDFTLGKVRMSAGSERVLPDAQEGTLRILTSGPLPPNPGEVVASRSVSEILAATSRMDADFVLVDAPPLLTFGDAGALALSVDGLLLVANVSKTRRPMLEEARDILQSLPCRKLGVVVVGEKSEDGHLAGYGSYSSK